MVFHLFSIAYWSHRRPCLQHGSRFVGHPGWTNCRLASFQTGGARMVRLLIAASEKARRGSREVRYTLVSMFRMFSDVFGCFTSWMFMDSINVRHPSISTSTCSWMYIFRMFINIHHPPTSTNIHHSIFLHILHDQQDGLMLSFKGCPGQHPSSKPWLRKLSKLWASSSTPSTPSCKEMRWKIRDIRRENVKRWLKRLNKCQPFEALAVFWEICRQKSEWNPWTLP